eukprot:TRINITY_DN66190_c0_g1_i1.p1 TRINITY_DN66190_c0_g1~~TRINITY_DN66190_c0_g1_i1.p1  ORF type:complete len:379 (-),score=13.98 TRINITY_DN66190_c0_g1_i1:336-1322(-)
MRTKAPAASFSKFYFVPAAVTISLMIFFYHVRVSFMPTAVLLFDLERKTGELKPGLEIWEVGVCLCIPLLAWRYRFQSNRLLLVFILAVISVLSAIIILHTLYRPSLCSTKGDSWISTDAGYIRAFSNTRERSVSMRALCDGKVFEPHVAQAIAEHLYGQGRAIDVGAFVGYNTLRLAKAAAPFDVYVFEGQPPSRFTENMRRNNAKNVQLIKETIDDKWTMSSDLEQALLNQDKGPLAFAKIDCEGCELYFLKGSKRILQLYHPVLVIEIQDDESRRNAQLGGQRMIKPTDTRQNVLDYLKDELGYNNVEPLKKNGVETWDYLAFRL